MEQPTTRPWTSVLPSYSRAAAHRVILALQVRRHLEDVPTVITSSAAAAAVGRSAKIVELIRGIMVMPHICYVGVYGRLCERCAKASDLL